ncbi:MAG: SDR family oxidoreductase [Alphaproteobacteria bacterium]|jgi:NAD(P)-dependent dehydrogenase (short-subunit alcohol dehydrogenase family)
MPTILITGASRGIGLESARQYAADGWKVLGCCRQPATATDLARIEGVSVHALDVTDFAAIDALAGAINEPIDVLMNNAGQSPRPQLGFGNMDYAAWSNLFTVNTLAPFKMAEAFQGHVGRSTRKLIVNVSSVMGSIAETAAGHVAYRSTKAALNMVTKTLAGDLADGIAVFSIHPGWVRTDMGGPSAAISTEESAAGMKAVVERASLESNGRFFNWTGEEIPW